MPLTAQQERYWHFYRTHSSYSGHHIVGVLELRGDLDVGALQDAWSLLIERHPPLRTSFVDSPRGPRGVLVALREPNVRLAEASQHESDVWTTDLARLAAREAQVSFELDSPPLARITLVRLQDELFGLLLAVHHSIGDGWSLRVLIRDLFALYTGIKLGRVAALPAISYEAANKTAVREHESIESPEMSARLRWWTDRLSDYAPPEVPALGTDERADWARGELTGPLIERLSELSRETGPSVASIVSAAFALAQAEAHGDSPLVINNVFNERTWTADKNLVGSYATFLPLVVPIGKRATTLEVAAGIEREWSACLEHRLPVWHLVRTTWPDHYLCRFGIAPLAINVHAVGTSSALRAPGLEIRPRPELMPSPLRSHFDQILFLQPYADGPWQLRTLFNTAVVSREEATSCMRRLSANLLDLSVA